MSIAGLDLSLTSTGIATVDGTRCIQKASERKAKAS